MQLNSVVMALAGAQRIFALLDEKPEADEGYVTLVNAKYEADGTADRERRVAPASGPGSIRTPTAPSPTPS